MTLKPLGDSAWLVEFTGKSGEAALARVMGLVDALAENRPRGVLDVVPSFASVAVHFSGVDGNEIGEWIGSVEVRDRLPEGGERRIPVCYGGECGPDLADVAALTGMTAEEVIERHSGATYTVAAVGFAPGFPYLMGLPECLQVARRRTPRLAVPAGSVAVAGGQAGIYPSASPGGWHVLGRTDVRLFDPAAEQPAFLQPGDRVRFVPVAAAGKIERPASPAEAAGGCQIEVIQPGAQTTVQDSGRPGYEHAGVSPGGAVDRQALRMGNLLLGNEEGAAGLEMCMSGPVLRFHAAMTVALAGATAKSRQVEAGETVDFTRLGNGVRAFLAVTGGISVPRVLGSASTDLRSGFGGVCGRALQAGDFLPTGEAGGGPAPGDWHAGKADGKAEIELRYLPGVQQMWFSDKARRLFRERVYHVSPDSDRMGARLGGPDLELAEPREMVSQPVGSGSVQVPPDGQPIVLLAGRQTIGGYPQIGQVISVDLPKLARAWPGTRVRFREVTRDYALALRLQQERDFKWLRTGLKLLT